MNKWLLLLLLTVGILVFEITGKIARNLEEHGEYYSYRYNLTVWTSATGLLVSVISLLKIRQFATGEKPFLVKTLKQKWIQFKSFLQFLKDEIRKFLFNKV